MAEGTRHNRSQWSDLNSAWTAVFEFTAAVAFYGGVGWYADTKLPTGHFLFFAGLILGMVLGIYVLMKRSDQAESQRVARQTHRARN